jgi:hypothetical protein
VGLQLGTNLPLLAGRLLYLCLCLCLCLCVGLGLLTRVMMVFEMLPHVKSR